MINIILSPSQQRWNKCLVCSSEANHCFMIAEKVYEYLRNYNCNVSLIYPIDGDERETLNEVVRISNEFVTNNPAERSFHLDIHTDAGGYAKGASGFYSSDYGKSFIMDIWREVSRLTPWGDGTPTKRDNLFVLNGTKAIAGLIELSFHDNKEEADWIHINIDQLAQAIVRGIVANTGIQLKDVKPVHWAEKHYKSLLGKGMVINERRFGDSVKRGELFALLDQIK